MGKRKADSDAEDDFEGSESEELERPKSKAQSKKTVKKPKIPDPDNDADEAPKLKKKKGKADKPASSKVQRGDDGDKFIDLGKKRRASVKEFKGSIYLDIREFYGADGDEKPGKKGITLQQEQWDALKNNIAEIDALFDAAKK